MSAHPLVSIGIPVFNAARWLRQSIQSALDQDWPYKEVIVVDDGSTDESIEIIQSFGSAIRPFFLPHGGQCVARNRIITEARGEWVQYLDADDYLLPWKISRQMAEAGDAASYDLLASPVWWEEFQRGGERHLVPAEGNEHLPPCRQLTEYQIPQTAGLLWKKRVLQDLGGWDRTSQPIEDLDLYMRAVRADCRQKYCPSPGVVYRVSWGGQQVSANHRVRLKEHLGLFLKMKDWMEARGEWTPELAETCAPVCFRTLRTLARLDLPAATELHERMLAGDLWQKKKIATRRLAPPAYALIYRWLGFSAAETMSRLFSKHDAPTAAAATT